MPGRRVVVTGVGSITPLANTFYESWRRLLADTSGIINTRHINNSGYESLSCKAAAPILDNRITDQIITLGKVSGPYSLVSVHFFSPRNAPGAPCPNL